MRRPDQLQPTDAILHRPPRLVLLVSAALEENCRAGPIQEVRRPDKPGAAAVQTAVSEEAGTEEEEEAGRSTHEPWALLCPAVLSALAVERERPGHGGFRLPRMSEPGLSNPSSGWRRSG